jgi:DNA-directed RNA polymerase specialized sigma24 family protein
VNGEYPPGAIFPEGWGVAAAHGLDGVEPDVAPSPAYGAESLADYVNHLRSVADPGDRAAAAMDAYQTLSCLTDIRREAVRQMRETMSAIEIAQRLGISRGKVHLLLRQD